MDSAVWVTLLVIIIIVLVVHTGVGVWCAIVNARYVDLACKTLLEEKKNRSWMDSFTEEKSLLEKKVDTNHKLLAEVYKIMRDASDPELPAEEIGRRMTERLRRMAPFFGEPKPAGK